jgi:hypothetical protein
MTALAFASSAGNADAASCTKTRPDVKVTAMTLKSLPSTRVQVSVTVTNIGQNQPPLGPGVGPQSVYLYRGSRWLDARDVPSLAAGGAYTAVFITPVSTEPFTAYYVPEPDSAGLLDCDGSNNSLTRPMW